jgi:DNA modification methylase
MPEADAIVTDPPYGLAFRGETWDATIPVWLSLARSVAPIVVFTTAPTTMWDYPRPDWVLNWTRQGSTSRTAYGGFNHWSPVLVYGRGRWNPDTVLLPSVTVVNDNVGIKHPSPKPTNLMRWLIGGCTADGQLVLDPFMGSGTTLVAAKSMNRRAIGIEIDERYCEVAANRCSQEVLGLTA